jgi:hypothetical protein
MRGETSGDDVGWVGAMSGDDDGCMGMRGNEVTQEERGRWQLRGEKRG